MGSQSDWPVMRAAAAVLDELGVGYEARVISAHRTPHRLYAFAKSARVKARGQLPDSVRDLPKGVRPAAACLHDGDLVSEPGCFAEDELAERRVGYDDIRVRALEDHS